MSDEKIEIKEIQKKLEQLSQKHLELVKSHQQRVKSHEEQKTLYEHLVGQPPLPPDPELQAVKEEIARLDRREQEYLKILQAAASIPPPVPEKDWSKSPFYSHTLKSWNFDYPVDQMGFYVTTLTGTGIVSKALWRSWNIKKAAEMLDNGVESEMLSFHRHFSGLNNEQLKDARMMRHAVKLKAFAFTGLLVTGFVAFVQLKNRNRFNK
ncbi:hypothetical protein ACHAW5_004855 [Stephanodiscus triporus]|uniref:Uncharacterized protein n=1 Tax=Stephanodiscus triporus TaxID=2934178 RepID=A0ABD3NDG6_9STRA